ncbi:MAG: HAMP domain-containing histidine kinase [Sulfuriferula sp.]|nr:HAMP domain-containing histidine kinase [Sulfuriferula sp.]
MDNKPANDVAATVDVAYTRLLRHNPKSFLKLILIGFSLVLLPLIIALVDSAVTINQLAEQSRQAVYQATQIAHSSRVLADEIVAMERSARQAMILDDDGLLEGYFHAHDKFAKAAAELAALNLSSAQKQGLLQLQKNELAIFTQVNASRATPAKLQDSVSGFSQLLDVAHTFSTAGYNLIEQEADALQIKAARARKRVVWQLLGLIPFAIILALGFSVVITRPIRQIEQAIRRMGQGQLNHAVRVEGPEDLSKLGDKLDWMRLRLLAVETQKNTFLRHVSHELKTPLTAIREGADLLNDGVLGELTPKQRQVTVILHKNSVQLQRRIEDLLSYSAIQQQQSSLIKSPVLVQSIVDAVLQDQALAVMNKALHIDLNISPHLTVYCDESKIQTVLDNLLSNAIKFSPSAGRITIQAQVVDNRVHLDVIDAGLGIDDADSALLFAPFYQGRRVAQGYTKGTGLGLAIAREYALAHGGDLRVIAREGVGAHFQLILPLNDR